MKKRKPTKGERLLEKFWFVVFSERISQDHLCFELNLLLDRAETDLRVVESTRTIEFAEAVLHIVDRVVEFEDLHKTP